MLQTWLCSLGLGGLGLRFSWLGFLGLGGRGFRLGFLRLFLGGCGLWFRLVMVVFVMGAMFVVGLGVFIIVFMLENTVMFMMEFRLYCLVARPFIFYFSLTLIYVNF
jgi:hypothetical protein